MYYVIQDIFNAVISPQTVLINARDLRRRARSTVAKDYGTSTFFKSELGAMLLFRPGLDSSFELSTSEGEDDNS